MKTEQRFTRSCHGLSLLGVWCASFLVLQACGGDDSKQEEEPFVIIELEPDQGDASDLDVVPDMKDEVPGDMNMPEPDMAEPDMSVVPDMALDMAEPDMPLVINDEPGALVFLNDPTTDNMQLTEVTLVKPTTTDGSLFNETVEVVNCLNMPGEELQFMGFTVGNLCQEISTTTVQDGDYLHIMPPAQYGDPNDTFAEVQMYYHVNAIHDYLHDELGVMTLPPSLPAIPNLQLYLNAQAAAFLGAQEGWQPFDNAAFLFPESFAQVGLPPRDSGAIVFGQGRLVDFAYDASVIRHEYIHSLIGNMRLNGVLVDRWGLNNTPGALNEALADYFAASMQENPVVGRYGLAAFGAAFARDLSERKTCPDHLTTAIHDDGRIIGSMLWEVRAQLGKEQADELIMRALLSATQRTEFKLFGESLVDEAALVSPEVETTVQGIIDEWGLRDCRRSREWTAWTTTGQPHVYTGKQALQGGANFGDFVPGYLQFYVDVPEGQSLELSWTLAQGQQGFGGGGAGKLDLITRAGQEITVTGGFGGNISVDHDHRFMADVTNNSQVIVLDSSCLASGGGRTHLMLVNAQNGDANVRQMGIRLIDDSANLPANTQTCPQ